MSIKERLKKLNILSQWKETQRDRMMLLGVIIATWIVIKIIEELVPQQFLDKLPYDVPLTMLGIVIILMVLHNIYLFIAQFQRRRNPRILNENFKPSVDVFISAHNEEAVIKDTIIYLANHDYEDMTIYAINDRSKDRTLEMMQAAKAKLGDKGSRVEILDRPMNAFPGKSAALNDALEISKGDVICVFDADARVDNGFIDQMVRYLEDPLVGAAQAQKVISNPERNFLTRSQFHEYAMDTYLQMGRDSIRGSVELRGNGQFVKRKALLQVGGWNEETLTDDLDLSTCLHVNGWDIRFSPENKVYEEGVPNVKALIKQRRRWAEGSIRRYLNYLIHIATPGNLSINQIFDTFVFIGQFGIPLWIAFDIVYEIIRFTSGRETYLTFLMLAGIGVWIVLFSSQLFGLRIYKKQGFFESLYNAATTNFYFTTLWITVVFITYRKILFSRTVGTWVRTEHGV